MAQIYDKALKQGDKRVFEIILIGYDESSRKHEKYIKKSEIKWPAIKFADIKSLERITGLGETGCLPCTALVSKDGKLVTNDDKKVLARLNAWVETGEKK